MKNYHRNVIIVLETLNHDMHMESLLQFKKEDKKEEDYDKFYKNTMCTNVIITVSNNIQQKEKVT